MSGVWADSTGFLGKPTTASTKLTTVGARTYNAVLGKFISVDPIIDTTKPQQNTGYAYAHNNPLTLSDPSGLRPDECGPNGVQCANSKVGGQWVPVNTPQGKYQGGGSSERTYGDKIADNWNKSWGGAADAWNNSWGGLADAWNKAWAGAPQMWEKSWGGAGAAWAKSWNRLPDRVMHSLKGAPGAFTNSMKGVPGAFMQSWIKFTDTPQTASWKGYEGSITATLCGGICVMLGVTSNGWVGGFGAGTAVGLTVNAGFGVSNTTSPRYEMSCDIATPYGGVGGSWAIDEGQNMDGGATMGGTIGPSWGAKIGCNAMFIGGL